MRRKRKKRKTRFWKKLRASSKRSSTRGGLNKKTAPVSAVFASSNEKNYLKSFGRRSVRLHFEHSAIFLIFPFSNMVFIMISPPQSGHMNLCVETDVREFLLAPAIAFLQNEFN